MGSWSEAKRKFIESAAKSKISMLHARYATCGKGELTEAHPFAIKRKGKIVLYGAHNGMIYNADKSAKKHNREIVVDSEEIFELLADRDYEGIKELQGYGVITWVEPSDPSCIYLLRLSKNSDIYVVKTTKGNIVYGSTRAIVDEALEAAGLEYKAHYVIDVGTIYFMTENMIFRTQVTGLKVKEQKKPKPKVSYLCEYKRARMDDSDIYRDISPRPRNNFGPSYGMMFGGMPKTADEWMKIFEQQDVEFSRQQQHDDYTDERNEYNDAEFETICEHCEEVIDEEEEEEVRMLYEHMFDNGGSKNLLCKQCLGIAS